MDELNDLINKILSKTRGYDVGRVERIDGDETLLPQAALSGEVLAESHVLVLGEGLVDGFYVLLAFLLELVLSEGSRYHELGPPAVREHAGDDGEVRAENLDAAVETLDLLLGPLAIAACGGLRDVLQGLRHVVDSVGSIGSSCESFASAAPVRCAVRALAALVDQAAQPHLMDLRVCRHRRR